MGEGISVETPSLAGRSLLVAESEGGCGGRLCDLTAGSRHAHVPVGGPDLPAGVCAEAADRRPGVSVPALGHRLVPTRSTAVIRQPGPPVDRDASERFALDHGYTRYVIAPAAPVLAV